MMRRRPPVARAKGCGHHIQPHPGVVGILRVEAGDVRLHAQAVPELSFDLDAAPLHPEPVGAHHVGQERVIDNSHLQSGRGLGLSTILLPPKVPSE